MTKDYSTWTESRREKSLEAMALKWSQMKFPSRSPLTPTERITSLDVLSRNPLPSSDQFWVIPERHSIPIFRRTVHQIAMRKLGWFNRILMSRDETPPTCTWRTVQPMTRESFHHRTSPRSWDGIVPRLGNPPSWVIDCQRPPSDVTKKSIHYGSKQLETGTSTPTPSHEFKSERASEQVSTEVSAVERTSKVSNVGRT